MKPLRARMSLPVSSLVAESRGNLSGSMTLGTSGRRASCASRARRSSPPESEVQQPRRRAEQHPRAFVRGAKVPRCAFTSYVLPLLERKHRAVAEATALHDYWRLAPVWQRARAELAKHTRKPDQEWVRMLRLMETDPPGRGRRAHGGGRPSSAIRRVWRPCGSSSGSKRLARRRCARRSRACVRSWRARCPPRRCRRMTRWWRAPAVPVDGRIAVAAPGRAGRPPASGAGRLRPLRFGHRR